MTQYTINAMHNKLALLLLLLISWESILFWPAFDTESLVHFLGQKVCSLFFDTVDRGLSEMCFSSFAHIKN